MFKFKNFNLLGFMPEIDKTYGVPVSRVMEAIPMGYVIKSVVLAQVTYPAHYTPRGVGPIFNGETVDSPIVSKGNIYLTQDLMVSNPLTEDREVESGHCCIVLKPWVEFKEHKKSLFDEPQEKSATKAVFLLNTFHIYQLSFEKIVAIIKMRGYTDLGFRIVKHGEWYLTHDLHIKQHDAKKIPHVFVRMVVTKNV